MSDGFVRMSDTNVMSRRVLTPDQRERVERVLDAAASWRSGGMSLFAAAKVENGHVRFLARMCTPSEDPRRQDLEAMVSRLIRSEGFEITTQGVYPRSELGVRDVVLHTSMPGGGVPF